MLAALCDFADQVEGSRSARHSRISDRCRNYIYNHLYEELPLGRLAEYAGMSASYLSQLFKKKLEPPSATTSSSSGSKKPSV